MVWGWWGGRDEPWRKYLREGLDDVLDEETGELIDIKPQDEDPTDVEGVLVRFRYIDVEGRATSRTLLCHQCWQDRGRIYVRGYCTNREALRTFRVDRMGAVNELRSGRIVQDALEYFGRFIDGELTAERDFSDEAVAKRGEIARIAAIEFAKARTACMPGLRVLTYIAMCDDRRDASEVTLIDSFLHSRLALLGIDPRQDLMQELTEIAAALAVPESAFSKAIRALKDNPNYLALVVQYATELATVDGTVDEAEHRALGRLLKAARRA